MKTLLYGLFFLGFASLSYSQNTDGIKEVALEAVTITPLNQTYLDQVKDKDTPEVVNQMEKKVARYDITELPNYDSEINAFEVYFKENSPAKSKIVATYDSDGNIISSYERFENVTLSPAVRNAVFKQYPGWTIVKDSYLVTYYQNKTVKKVYKLKISHGKTKKTLRLDPKGNII